MDQENTKALNSPGSAVTTRAVDVPADPQLVKARTAWSAIGLKLRRITPSQLSRFVLAIAVGGALLGLTVSLLNVLVPFEIGLVLAYVTIPLVDWLDKRVPRSVAVALVMLAEFALLAGFVGLVVPILVNQVGVVLSDLPSQDERRRFFTDLVTSLRAVLPPVAQDFVKNAVQQATTDIEQNAATYLSTIVGIIASAVLGVVGTISFALSLLVLPTWLFAVLRDRKSGVRFVNNMLPKSWLPDFWAPLRIADRTLGFYLRGLFIQALAVTVAAFFGLQILEALDYGPFNYPVLLAMTIGLTQLIPTFGPFVGYILGGLAGLSHSPDSGVAVVVMLVAVHILNNTLVASKVQGKVVDLHPAILAVLLVAGSQFGLLGVLLAAPVGVMLRDIYRYVNGRLSDPPRPAGLLPGDARKAATQGTVPGQAVAQGASSATGLRVPTGTGIPAYRATSTQRIAER